MSKKKADLALLEFMLRGSGARLSKLYELKAPDIIKFNEFKILQSRFNEWCELKGIDPDHGVIDREKMN